MDFFNKYKKIFIAIGFVLSVFVLGYLIYITFFKSDIAVYDPDNYPTSSSSVPIPGFPSTGSGSNTNIVDDKNNQNTLPIETGNNFLKPSEIAKGGLTQTTEIGKAPSLGATLSIDGSDLRYYNKSDGKFYSLDKNGNSTLLVDKVFHNVEKVTWSNNNEKAILEYPDGANIIYNFNTNKQITLPKHWEEFDFSPNNDQLVMKSIGLDPSNRWLAVTNEDGSKVTPIEFLGENESMVYPKWSPNNEIVAMYTKGVDFDRQEVFFMGLNDENFKSTIVEGRDFRPQWSPEGDKLLYSVYTSKNNFKPSLWLVDAQGESIGANRKSLNLETWADKCTFSNAKELYCSVPEKIDDGAGIFPELANNTKDRLYKIDTQTGIKKMIAIPDGDFNMTNLIITDNSYYLYFTDAKTERIHKIKLK